MKRLFLVLLCCWLFLGMFAQRIQKVCGEYVYYAPENIFLEEARRIALERAKLTALADAFGCIVSQSNTAIISNQNGKSKTDFFSLGSSEIKGEWLKTEGTPQYAISYEKNMLVVKVSVCGKAREKNNQQIDFIVKLLRNGTEKQFESSEFCHGDSMYLYFQSPVSGFLTVYLLDDISQTVYCLLPYRHCDRRTVEVKHDTPYIFFSQQHETEEATLVDEYTLTCNGEKEHNTFYVIFSPNNFVKANAMQSHIKQLPRQLPFKDFQTWLFKAKTRDKELNEYRIPIVISP